MLLSTSIMAFTLNVRPVISGNPGTHFSDDFSTDSGMWKYSGSAQRDSTNQYLVLTEPVNDLGGVALFNNTFTDCFTANFSYKAGGGTGADGFAFFFYKQNYSAPWYGGTLAFNGLTMIPGYGIEFDNWGNVYGGEPSPPKEHADPSANHIALIKDHVGNHLLYVNDLRTEDNAWHNVTVRVKFSSVKVFVDGDFIFQWNGTLDRAFNCFGFCGATGSGTNWHIIDNFQISIDPLEIYDLATTDITSRKTVVNQGQSTEVNVTVSNQGNYTETFNLTLSALSPNLEPIVNTTGLVGYWDLNEGNGTVACDRSIYGNNGTLIGPAWTNGRYGKALNFDGIDDYAIISDSPSLRVQAFTLEAWIYMTVRPYQAGHPSHPHVCIVNKMHFYNTAAKAGYKLDFEYPTATDDTLVISIGDGVAQRFLVQYNSINDLTLNQWHQVVGTYDGETARIYIDGQQKATGGGSYTILHDSTPLCFSREISQPAYDGFNGIIDNVMIYSRALSSEEVQTQFSGRHSYYIQNRTITLAKGDSTIVSLTWNTTGFAYGNYTLAAYISPVLGEIDIMDNTLSSGIVTVTIAGDVDGNFVVDILDAVKITSIYTSKLGDQAFDPNCDLRQDNIIDILDVVKCAGHYGERYP
jgi:hypothetical protein